MSYRNKHGKPIELLRKFDVRNGACAKLAFACFYLHGHDQHYHDHIGWPNSSHPDFICQMDPFEKSAPWLPRQRGYKLENLVPIHLIEEGYDTLEITFANDKVLPYVETSLAFNEEEDNQIDCIIAVNLPTFVVHPRDYPFTVFVSKSGTLIKDAVCHAILRVLPGSSTADSEDVFTYDDEENYDA